MKYFLDTEFHEYKTKPFIGKSVDTIELISIGIVSGLIKKTLMPPCDVYSETGDTSREYYAICKDFDVSAAWNSFQNEINKQYPLGPEYNKVYWLRENVLRPIFDEFILKEKAHNYRLNQLCIAGDKIKDEFTLGQFKKLLKKYGKSKIDIAYDIKRFIYSNHGRFEVEFDETVKDDIEFYAYYADYDWVVFCWLFGKLIYLPKGFPKYCNDLKQTSDELYAKKKSDLEQEAKANRMKYCFLNSLSDHLDYPKQTNKHNALDDAKWNLKLYNFLKNL